MSNATTTPPVIGRNPPRPAWLLAGIYLFGVGFGFVEAAVVVDLRAIVEPAVARAMGGSTPERFPMIPFDRVARDDPAVGRLLRIEVLREAATLVTLAGVGIAAGRSFVGRFSAFVAAFGVWDLTYYVSLRLMSGWPRSIWTWDVLFLIPVPWAAPVLAPGIVAATMVLAGSIAIVAEATGRPFHIARRDWLAIVAGGLILIGSFCRDWRNIAAGGLPNPFSWPLFLAGQAVGLGGFARAWRSTGRVKSADREAPRPVGFTQPT